MMTLAIEIETESKKCSSDRVNASIGELCYPSKKDCNQNVDCVQNVKGKLTTVCTIEELYKNEEYNENPPLNVETNSGDIKHISSKANEDNHQKNASEVDSKLEVPHNKTQNLGVLLQERRSSLPLAIENQKSKRSKSSKMGKEPRGKNGIFHKKHPARGRTSSLPDVIGGISSYHTSLNMDAMSPSLSSINSGLIPSEPAQNAQIKCLKVFFLDYWMHKMICSIPFGFIMGLAVVGIATGPVIFISYVLLFTVAVFYPIISLIWQICRQFRPYYELWKYTPNTENPSPPPEPDSKKEEIDEREENSIQKTSTNYPKLSPLPSHKINKHLFNANIERKPSLRRSSILPAIKEKRIEEDDEYESEIKQNGK